MPFRDVSPGAVGMAELAQAPVNAFYAAKDQQAQEARRNHLTYQDDLDDERWHQAVKTGDWATAFKIDPDATQMYQQHAQQQASSGLGDIAVTAKPVDESAIYERGRDERKFAADEKYRRGMLGVQYAQERRLSQPTQNGELSFAEYEALPPERKAAYDQFKGRNKGGGGVSVDPETGALTVNPGKTNDVMRTASGFVARMSAAEKLLGDYMPTTTDYMAATRVMQSGPMMASAANAVLSEKGQSYYQAAADWVRAKLRKESGAVIGPEEMAQEIKTYFPVPNDPPSVVEQKKQARAQAVLSLKTQAGGAVTPEAGYSPNAPGTVRKFDRNGNPVP